MSGRYFITSRQGFLSYLPVFHYSFSKDLPTDAKKKLCSWLSGNPENQILEIRKDGFSTTQPLKAEKTNQYSFSKEEKFEPPYNTTQLSGILSKLINRGYRKLYSQYLNKNIFVLSSQHYAPFRLDKCFVYNIELFPDGYFFIHFFPTSKIVSDSFADENYLTELIRNYRIGAEDNMTFTLTDIRTYKRRKFNLIDKTSSPATGEIAKNKCIATFDYHFLASYKKEAFVQISENTNRLLNKSLEILQPVSKELPLLDFIQWHSKPFFEINITPLLLRNNLLLGSNKKANLQSAAFYSGIYKQVDDFIIQPFIIGKYNAEEFKKLIYNHFNQSGTAEVYDAIHQSSSDPIDLSQIKRLTSTFGDRILFAVFTQYQLPADYLTPLAKLGCKFQVFSGSIDQHRLSNFVVKCLEKASGILCVIDNLYEPESTYFIGLDMGHTTHNDDNYTNLGMVVFDNKGQQLLYRVETKLPKNEALNVEALKKCFAKMQYYLKKSNRTMPEKLIIHRDGKCHIGDAEALKAAANIYFNPIKLDIVEVIKSGYPVIANLLAGNYMNLKSGEYWLDPSHEYAILVTNTQPDENGEMLNPIILKHHYGTTQFHHLVEQLYWFTKVYTNNLFTSTRLPATTEKANNLVSTGNIRHSATYSA